MTPAPIAPVVLVILDGWGYREATEGNAIAVAKTPIMDSLQAAYPYTLIQASGKAVGLPQGQMGNSEVGHMNIGAGRIVKQELLRITDAVEDGSLLENPVLQQVCQQVKARSSKLHFIGLCSEGGVHSHLDHLFGLLKLAQVQEIEQVCIHAITDGRDTYPTDGLKTLQKLQAELDLVGVGQIVTVMGRYYAMDRDRRWDRIQKAYQVITDNTITAPGDAISVLEASYAQQITDEFVIPVRCAPGAVEPGDGIIFFNFRPDRARQLTQVFVAPHFEGFERPLIDPLAFVTFTQYDSTFPVSVAFEPQNLNNILAEVLAHQGLRQFRTAETEKYAHVTYFFNGGLEEPVEGEDRELVPSPQVPTYDQQPSMSAAAVTEVAIAAIAEQVYSLVVINYANPDMVGHTGIMAAAVEAVETVDQCLGRLIEAIGKVGGTTLIIADHGNAELMYDEQKNPWTAHTTNPVPFILVEGEKRKIPGHGANVVLRSDGCLADIAPTILEILQIPQPVEMTGKSIFQSPAYELQRNRSPVSLLR